ALADGFRREDLQVLSPAWAAAAAELLPQVAADDPSGDPPRSEKDAPRRRMFEAFAALSESVSAHGHAVLVIDDYPWADDSTVALRPSLARRLSGSRLLVVIAVRTDELRNDWAVRVLIERATGEHLRRVRPKEFDVLT